MASIAWIRSPNTSFFPHCIGKSNGWYDGASLICYMRTCSQTSCSHTHHTGFYYIFHAITFGISRFKQSTIGWKDWHPSHYWRTQFIETSNSTILWINQKRNWNIFTTQSYTQKGRRHHRGWYGRPPRVAGKCTPSLSGPGWPRLVLFVPAHKQEM